MKKTAFLIMIAVLCAAVLTSCSEKTAEGQSGFKSPAALAGLLSAYFKSLDTNLLYPSENAAASSDIEFSYSTEDGVQTEHKALAAAYFKEKKALSVGIGDHEIDVAGTVSFDGTALRDITSEFMFRTVSSAFVTAFCDKSSSGDFTTAPDSIRAAEDDVEVSRITLKLDEKRYGEALDLAISSVEGDEASHRFLSDIADFYCFLHGREQSGEELLAEIKEALLKTKNNGGVVWQRYVRNGVTVAERIKVGDDLFRYIIAEAETYTELDLEARLGGKTFTAAYEMRKTGMSDSYNIRLAAGDEITYFDGKAESAFKSGTAEFRLRATKNENVVNAFEMTVKFNGVNKLTYTGNGSKTKNGGKKTFDFELVFSPKETSAPAPAQGSAGITEAIKKLAK